MVPDNCLRGSWSMMLGFQLRQTIDCSNVNRLFLSNRFFLTIFGVVLIYGFCGNNTLLIVNSLTR